MSARGDLVVVVVVALLAAPACGGTAKDSSTLTAEEFPTRYAAVFCELTSRCCAFAGGEPRSDDCQADYVAEQQSLATAAAQSGASFDVQAAEDCLAALESRRCEPDPLNPLAGFLPVCRVWRGHVPPGQACRLDLDCSREGDRLSSCVEDRCQVVEALFTGSDCDPHDTTAVCASGFSRCDAETRRCEPLPRTGEPCSDACHIEARCLDGVCQELGTEGAGCNIGSDCHGGVCLDGHCAPLLAGQHCAAPE